MGRELFGKGKHEEAERYLQRALQEARIGFGEREAHVAAALNNLAELYRVQRNFSKAEPLYLEALNIIVVKLQGSPLDAAALVRQSLSILEEAGMVETLDGLRRYGRLAQILIEAKKVEEAEPVQRRILQMFE
eukprot:gene14892-17605_t